MSTADQQRRWRAKQGARTGRPGPEPSAECGTTSGYKRHKREGDPKCDACWAANAKYQRDRYADRHRSSPPTGP